MHTLRSLRPRTHWYLSQMRRHLQWIETSKPLHLRLASMHVTVFRQPTTTKRHSVSCAVASERWVLACVL